mmetsp:Transcript_64876/g.180594  ORF Transcript_64876/g.180594 Transcript_64876/m.180594 type:complete len:269 (+) Transcript_64876:263-1069(+)
MVKAGRPGPQGRPSRARRRTSRTTLSAYAGLLATVSLNFSSHLLKRSVPLASRGPSVAGRWGGGGALALLAAGVAKSAVAAKNSAAPASPRRRARSSCEDPAELAVRCPASASDVREGRSLLAPPCSTGTPRAPPCSSGPSGALTATGGSSPRGRRGAARLAVAEGGRSPRGRDDAGRRAALDAAGGRGGTGASGVCSGGASWTTAGGSAFNAFASDRRRFLGGSAAEGGCPMAPSWAAVGFVSRRLAGFATASRLIAVPAPTSQSTR